MAFKSLLLELLNKTEDVTQSRLHLERGIRPLLIGFLEKVLLLDPWLCWFFEDQPLLLTSLEADTITTLVDY